MLLPVDVQILIALATYDTLTRDQITRLLFPNDRDGRVTRRHLQKLRAMKLLNRTNCKVVGPQVFTAAPVYFSSRDGAAYLCQELGDDRFRFAPTREPYHALLHHFCAVAETHILLDRAVAKIDGVEVTEWYGERSVVNPDVDAPEKRFKLYVRFSPKLVCVPDAAFLLNVRGHAKAFYLEQDRHSTYSADRVAAQKFGGYRELADEANRGAMGHRRHFPNATVDEFGVLVLSPSANRREALKRAVARKGGGKHWLFASLTDVNEELMLTGPIWHTCENEVKPILKSPDGVRVPVRNPSEPAETATNGSLMKVE